MNCYMRTKQLFHEGKTGIILWRKTVGQNIGHK